METGRDLQGQHLFGPFGMQPAAFDLPFHLGDLFQGAGAEQLVVAPHQFVGDRHQLGVDLFGRLGDADIVAQTLGHLLHPVEPFQDRHHQHRLLFAHVVGPLQMASHQEVELLIGPAQLDVTLHGHTVVPLQQRIEELADGDALAAFVTLFEVVALQHPRHVVLGGQLDQSVGPQGVEPGGVEHQLRLLGVEDLEGLLLIGLGISPDRLPVQDLAGLALAGGITDHGGEISDQELNDGPLLLESRQFL